MEEGVEEEEEKEDGENGEEERDLSNPSITFQI